MPTCQVCGTYIRGTDAHFCGGTPTLSNIPDSRGWGPTAEMGELRKRIERLEKIVEHICPDKSDDV